MTDTRASDKPLRGVRVLVPRGGKWGDNVSAILRSYGASPVIAPLINFAPTADQHELMIALLRLEAGEYDWLVVTSATTVDVLIGNSIRPAPTTKVAAVGETTAAALTLAGIRVDFVPENDNSARGLVKEWPTDQIVGRVLVPQSEIAEPRLVEGLAARGLDAEFVAAYRTVGVSIDASVKAEVADGSIRVILVTSGSVARQIAEQLAPLPRDVLVACIGPRTAFDARAAGLPVHVIAETRSAPALVEAVVDNALAGWPEHTDQVTPGSPNSESI
ncbi:MULTISPECIES: uroporphyrinogen-III synthase [unclassified Frondihabitans]|uniref:uroporphyrinogen-III synthase n=1 Tax=unclassified Frondihabitans TaxID=2626248 RepID=UPI000F50D71E|nr:MULTISPECIES: uroporphyrinogen-III synthase [unclassified Frondihabitans]MBF4575102.1 uroporphyrinogen-III synthase [Frondihabitans sp. VKM Ac-2883]RPE77712.1 uroporphyrinogen-III synthase [Frondihabitans sp. PhB153]RPF07990.1 uroporphyrinogen-III synthase [Frondihabitans sp. PhB161]